MMELIELRVPMQCEACEKSIRKALSRMIGVESVDVDMKQQRVTVMGYVDREKILKKVRRTLKFAEVWPFRHHHHHHHQQHHPSSFYSKHRESEHWPQSHHQGAVGFWPSTHNGISDPYVDTSNRLIYAPYEDVTHHFKYNYDHGYEDSYLPPEDDKVTTMFTEENANACSIM